MASDASLSGQSWASNRSRETPRLSWIATLSSSACVFALPRRVPVRAILGLTLAVEMV
jgi:hypothetical protein